MKDYNYLNIICFVIVYIYIQGEKNVNIKMLKILILNIIYYYINIYNLNKKIFSLKSISKIYKKIVEDSDSELDSDYSEDDYNNKDSECESNENNIKIKIFKNIASINGYYNKIKSNYIFNNKLESINIKTNNIISNTGIYDKLDTDKLIAQNIYNDIIESNNIISENIKNNNLLSNNINTKYIDAQESFIKELETNNIKSNNAEINNLNTVLLNSKELISETIFGENIKTDNIDLNNGNFNKIIGNEIEAKDMTILSDRRRKKNIIYNPISSDLLDNIDMVSFEYKESNKNHIGFIAQDVELVYPELIKHDENGFLSVKYLEMIPLIIDYNKNLKKKLLNIEKKLNL
jgi:hypothetical protein